MSKRRFITITKVHKYESKQCRSNYVIVAGIYLHTYLEKNSSVIASNSPIKKGILICRTPDCNCPNFHTTTKVIKGVVKCSACNIIFKCFDSFLEHVVN